MAQRRPGGHLCPALPLPRVRLSAGDEQRGLARDAEVRHSGARSRRPRAAAEAAQRLRRDEEVLDAPEELRQPVVGVGRSARRAGPREARFAHVMDPARQSRAMVFAWWNTCIIRPYCAADGGAGGGTEEEAELGQARFVISQDSHIDFVLFSPL